MFESEHIRIGQKNFPFLSARTADGNFGGSVRNGFRNPKLRKNINAAAHFASREKPETCELPGSAKRKPHQQNTVKDAQPSDAFEPAAAAEERMNEAVKRVLHAQHRAAAGPRVSMTQEDAVRFGQINTDCISAFLDEGVSPALDREGRHCFIVLTEDNVDKDGHPAVDTQVRIWYQPDKIAEKLRACFPNSECLFLPQFPSAAQNCRTLERQLAFDDVVFVTFFQSQAYIGRESFTSRIQSVIEALQVTDRIRAIVHFGNPFLLEELAHIPRRIIGCTSYDCTMATVDVLAGLYPAKGRMPYTLHLQ